MKIERLYNNFLCGTLNQEKRPILAFTMKPRLGMNVDDISKMYEAAAKVGIDIVEDDERLLDPLNCPFRERVKAISRLQQHFPTIYSVNITADSENALKKLDFCVENQIRMVKVDVLVCGFETLRKVATKIRDKYNSKIAITVYPDAYGAFRRLGRRFILKLSRLCGADIIYAGSPNWARYVREKGNLEHTIYPVYQRHELLESPLEKNPPRIKATLPTITNDQHPSRAELLITHFRKYHSGHYKYAFFVGGGISGFPADIREASEQWLNCIRHAASAELSNYKNYDFSNYDSEFREMDWTPFDVEGELDVRMSSTNN